MILVSCIWELQFPWTDRSFTVSLVLYVYMLFETFWDWFDWKRQLWRHLVSAKCAQNYDTVYKKGRISDDYGTRRWQLSMLNLQVLIETNYIHTVIHIYIWHNCVSLGMVRIRIPRILMPPNSSVHLEVFQVLAAAEKWPVDEDTNCHVIWQASELFHTFNRVMFYCFAACLKLMWRPVEWDRHHWILIVMKSTCETSGGVCPFMGQPQSVGGFRHLLFFGCFCDCGSSVRMESTQIWIQARNWLDSVIWDSFKRKTSIDLVEKTWSAVFVGFGFPEEV